MSDAAHAEPRAAALESSGPSDAMKPCASKTWRGWRADVRRSHRAASMESPDARKTRGGGPADMDSCGSAKPMQAAAASKTRGDRRADAGNAGGVKLMKIAAAKAAVESAASKPGGDGRGAGVETGRRMNAGCAKLTKPWTTAEGRSANAAAQPRGRDASAKAAGRRAGIDGV
jgi:hypothetical protein